MKSASEFKESLISECTKSKFLPYGNIKLGVREKEGLTLHELVRNSLGMKAEDSVYMYWEWKELKISLDKLWEALDNSASEILGRRTSAIAYATDVDRSSSEILRLVEQMDLGLMVPFPNATRRPTKSESQVRYVGKLMGACLNTLGILEQLRDSGYGDLFGSLPQSLKTNVDLLEYLDSCIADFGLELKDISPMKSVVIVRALGFALQATNKNREIDDLEPLTLSEFLFETEDNANWSGLSDQVVLKRLLTIAPDETETAKKAIDKFLAQ